MRSPATSTTNPGMQGHGLRHTVHGANPTHGPFPGPGRAHDLGRAVTSRSSYSARIMANPCARDEPGHHIPLAAVVACAICAFCCDCKPLVTGVLHDLGKLTALCAENSPETEK